MSKVHWQAQPITKADRVKRNLKGQRPALVWLTGLSGSGKSALAAALELELFSRGLNTYSLDGDNVRHGLCRDLGFTEHDRNENIRRVGEVAALMVDAGLIVIASFISPFRSDRQMVRQILEPGEFIEVYLNAPLKVCEQRDPKGLYRKARAGEIKDFTGISSPYEPPETPEVIVDSSELTLPESVALVIDALKAKKAI